MFFDFRLREAVLCQGSLPRAVGFCGVIRTGVAILQDLLPHVRYLASYFLFPCRTRTLELHLCFHQSLVDHALQRSLALESSHLAYGTLVQKAFVTRGLVPLAR